MRRRPQNTPDLPSSAKLRRVRRRAGV